MIRSSRQLKDKIRNLSGNNSRKAQVLLREFFMERFLERISLSEYNEKFILKGGLLVASLVGLDMRATMDIDTTVRAMELSVQNAERIIGEITNLNIDDGITFSITDVSEIMEEHEYSGIRFMIEGVFENIRQPIKIDISTGDKITPSAISYSYKLMFEDRSISVFSYNVETLLAEKLETVISRSILNTRIRDFYDIYTLIKIENVHIDYSVLSDALTATAANRNTVELLNRWAEIMSDIQNDNVMKNLWKAYQTKNDYAADIFWDDIITLIIETFTKIKT